MESLKQLVTSLPPAYHWPAQLCLFSIATTWILSIVTGNVSQVDRVWTFLPVAYTAYYALLPLWPQEPPFFLSPYTPKSLGWVVARDFSPRAILMLSLVFVWMSRLSYNTYRRGLFNLKDEDYRWLVLRNQLPPWLFQVVNLTFIAAIQNILLLTLGYPTMIAAVSQPHTSLASSDITLAILALVVLGVEFTSDNQQYSFQSYKHAYLASKKGNSPLEPYDPKKQWPGSRLRWTPADAERGFTTRGLWAYSRHPNFACEQSFWWIINLIPLLSPSPPHLSSGSTICHLLPSPSVTLYNFPHALYPFLRAVWASYSYVLPASLLSVLFFSSTLYTESISLGKYPGYEAYRERVGMFGVSWTLWKGLWLTWTGRKAEVEALLWGSGEKVEKKE